MIVKPKPNNLPVIINDIHLNVENYFRHKKKINLKITKITHCFQVIIAFDFILIKN